LSRFTKKGNKVNRKNYLSKQDKVGGKIKKGKRITSWGIKGLKVVVLCPGYIYTF
jgi:hypothetical protein